MVLGSFPFPIRDVSLSTTSKDVRHITQTVHVLFVNTATRLVMVIAKPRDLILGVAVLIMMLMEIVTNVRLALLEVDRAVIEIQSLGVFRDQG